MLLGIVHDKAVSDALQHGDIVVGVAHSGGVGDIDVQALAEMSHARPLVDAQIHKVYPLAARIGDVESVRECRVVVLAKRRLGIVGGEKD